MCLSRTIDPIDLRLGAGREMSELRGIHIPPRAGVADLAGFHLQIPRLPHQPNNVNMIAINYLNSAKDAQWCVASHPQVSCDFRRWLPRNMPVCCYLTTLSKTDIIRFDQPKDKNVGGPNRDSNAGPRAVIMQSIPKRESYH